MIVGECSFCADGVDLVYGLVAMGSSSTYEIDSLPVSSAVQSTKVLRELIQPTEK